MAAGDLQTNRSDVEVVSNRQGTAWEFYEEVVCGLTYRSPSLMKPIEAIAWSTAFRVLVSERMKSKSCDWYAPSE